MNHKTIKLSDSEFLIGVPYTFFKIFKDEYKTIITEDENERSIRISPYAQWNAFMLKKVNEGNRIIQNVSFNRAYEDDDPEHTIVVKFEVTYTE